MWGSNLSIISKRGSGGEGEATSESSVEGVKVASGWVGGGDLSDSGKEGWGWWRWEATSVSPVKGGGVGCGDFSVISQTGWGGAISVSSVKRGGVGRFQCHQ